MPTKPEIAVHDALYVHGKLFATLSQDDVRRGWAAGKNIITSHVIRSEGNRYETLNTIYIVEGELLTYVSTI